jgi:type II secretory pathway pseudopilin PulG
MEPKGNTAKFAFFYMLSLVALIFMALSTGMIIFQIINKNIPDILNIYQGAFSSAQLKFAISALIISAPIFYICMRQIYSNLKSGELEKDSGIRKWLTYFILFVSSVVMIGWLITTVNTFLDGDLTIKFILKALTALLISAAVFSFYFYDIKRADVQAGNKIIRIYFYSSLIIILVAFVASLFAVESPTQTRARKYDNLILNNFNNIDSAINSYYREYGKIPKGLDELKSEYSYIGDNSVKDPEKKSEFGYRVVDENAYELCAEFKISNKNDDSADDSYYKDRWLHEAGYQCLQQKVHDEDGSKTPVMLR